MPLAKGMHRAGRQGEKAPIGMSDSWHHPAPRQGLGWAGRRERLCRQTPAGAAWLSVQVSLFPSLLPGALPRAPCHSPSGVTEAGLGTLLLGAPCARIVHPADPWAAWAAAGAPSLRPPPSWLSWPCPSEPVLPPKAVAGPPTSARALGGSLFRGHKAPLILCWAPSHVTRWAGRTRERPARPDSAAG